MYVAGGGIPGATRQQVHVCSAAITRWSALLCDPALGNAPYVNSFFVTNVAAVSAISQHVLL